MKITTSLFLLFFMSISLFSQTQKTEVNLWQNEIPDSISDPTYKEKATYKDSVLTHFDQVTTPTLTIFKPKNPNGTAILIFPGGGYSRLSIDKEGYKVGEWLNTLGITGIVVKYRLPSKKIMKDQTIGPLQDAQEAMRYVRRNAKILNINPNKIGAIGFSAGGHLASTLATKYDDVVYEAKEKISAKPDFSILVYPVIEMNDEFTHQGSKKSLLGVNTSQELIEKFSTQKNVTEETSPTFLVHATDDKAVPVENSIDYYLALKNKKVSAELHIYEKGGHGFGLGKLGTNENWPKQLELWLKVNHYLD